MQAAPLRAPWRNAGLLLPLALALAACADHSPTEPRLDPPSGLRPSAATALAIPTPPGHIRIGVVPSALSLTLGSRSAFSLQDRVTGEVIASGDDELVTVELAAAGTPRTRDWLQIVCTGSTSRRDQLVGSAAAAGFETRYERVDRNGAFYCWRIFFGTLPPGSSSAARAGFAARLQQAGLPTSTFWRTLTIVDGETKLRVVRGGTETIVIHPVVMIPQGGIVEINGAPYRGVAEVWTNSTGTLAGINELPLEQYLYGVVPRELPPRIWDELEAQKAQAVAARTFTLTRRGGRRADGYDLTATVSDQVYGGVAAEHPLSTRAVNETAGMVATYDGRLIESLFSSTSGGFTADNEEVFGSVPVAYLRGVPDSQRGQAFAHVPTVEVFKNAKNAASLRTYRPSDHESDWSRYYRWTVSWTPEEMREVISAHAGVDAGAVLAINVLERGRSGRVVRIEYVTENGTFWDAKDRIRSSLRFVNASGGLSNLFSTLFFIEPQIDPRSKQITGWTAYGGGWGHGVGLSQTGAVGMAEKGATYEQILKHYYQGIDLQSWTP